MKKRGRWVAIILICALLLGIFGSAVVSVTAANVNKGSKKWNIVFVTDESLSMDDSDPEKLRYDAIRLFTQEITDKGNYLGSVSFAGKIIDTQNIRETNGKSAKDQYADQIASVRTTTYTNIGGALKEASDMLDANRNTDYNSAIIILSDGNTEMPNKDARELSLENKADAVEACRKNGYKIYAICLNVDGSADGEELRQLATATGGEFTEVRSAGDLLDVETLYYRMLYSGSTTDDSQEEGATIGADGSVSKRFNVPAIGVEELNIVIDGSVREVAFTDPAGTPLSKNDVDNMTTYIRGQVITKLVEPAAGTWTVTAYGDPNAEISLRYMFNTNFYIETNISPASGYMKNSPVTFTAEVYDGSGRITNDTDLRSLTGSILVTSGDDSQTIPMQIQNGAFVGQFTPDKEGTYYASITVENDLMSDSTTEPYEISVDNAPPVPPAETPTAHANIWPIVGGKATIDLNGTATDPDGDKLTYTIDSTAFKEGDYDLSGGKLTVSHYSIRKGSFTIKASDPQGAYCKFDVLFTSTNIGLIMAIVTLIGILLALVILILLIRKLAGVPFMGSITVSRYDSEDMDFAQPMTLEPSRGQKMLTAFGFGDLGFAKKTHFQAAGKEKKVIFKSSKPFYSDVYPGGLKQLDIKSGMESIIYPTPDKRHGITVRFTSVLDDNGTGDFMF